MKDEKIIIGVIGTGGRGQWHIGALCEMDDVEVAAVCDVYEDRVERAVSIVKQKTGKECAGYIDYRELLKRSDIKGVIIASSWTSHIPIAVAAMKAGKYAGIEAGGAASVEECWSMVRAYEETGKPCMLLENCCYGRTELALLNMVNQNIFGELVHCQCGYEHDLRHSIGHGIDHRHYRSANYINRNGELYPMHGLGPMAKILKLNSKNRMLTLVSFSSKARGMSAYVRENLPPEHQMQNVLFNLGDVVTTMIKCLNGETILLTHDTSLPRPYSRAGRVQGTKGIWMEDNNSIHIENRSPGHTWEPFEPYMKEYEHPLWQDYFRQGIKESGHGGMDYLVIRAFVEAVRDGTQTPIDVYDTASWVAVTCLSEESIQLGGNAVVIPDFTSGKWFDGSLIRDTQSKYSLE